MQLDFLISLIQDYGYPALFFALWLGIVGMPIPDEIVVMTGGMVSSFDLLHPVPAFIVTYLGVISGLSLGYVLGRKVGSPILDRLRRKKKVEKYIARSNQLLEKYGSYALVFSYFLPVVRHVVPYLVGIGNMPFRRYALFSYTTGLAWTLLLFMAGHYFGNNMDAIASSVTQYGWYVLIALLLLLVGGWSTSKWRKKVIG